jgi:predicted DNA-binding transcriptional regulator AlpA
MGQVVQLHARRRIVRLEEASAYLGHVFRVSTLRRWANDGTFPAQKIGGQWVTDLDQVDAWYSRPREESPEPLLSKFQQAKERIRSLKTEAMPVSPRSSKGGMNGNL